MTGHAVDLLVLGSGAAGLAAAVTGAAEGLSVLVLEKTEWLGGTSAYSAGTSWIPGHRHQPDPAADVAEARRYLDVLVGDRAPRELRETYLRHGPEAIEYFERLGLRFWHSASVVDYHPELPGSGIGRALEPYGNALVAALYDQLTRRSGSVWFTARTAELPSSETGLPRKAGSRTCGGAFAGPASPVRTCRADGRRPCPAVACDLLLPRR
ncbi:FAD-dependent oxidoreductase [Amycolatopsis sp. NPDC058278]|uniref:FAD-dependent oxidoreductase n=1 Tax=Amycolatopsis sp. NPDC058278 TaxID=3346417 RepID=UPI0036DDF82A